jgi:hypothetical protein
LRKALASARAVRRDSRAARKFVAAARETGEVDLELLQPFLNYDPDSILVTIAGRISAVTTWVGAAVAVVAGTAFAAYPEIPAAFQSWTPFMGLGARLHSGFNYLHSIHNSHVDQPHLIYHLADLGFDAALISPLYVLAAKAFVFFGWRRHVNALKRSVRSLVEEGQSPAGARLQLRWKMRPGYTGILVGDGDELGDEFARRHPPNEVLLFATRKPEAGPVWVRLRNDAGVRELESAFSVASFEKCGRLVLLPVQSQHMVFPPPDAYDISPDKLDDLLRNIRKFDLRRATSPLPVIVVGDRSQTTVIDTFDSETHGPLPDQSTSIDLAMIQHDCGDGLMVVDPTDLVLERVCAMAGGARVVFRGTEGSRQLYEAQFLRRLADSGYRVTDPGRVFRMGYNITDDPTVADPMNSAAVVLTAGARDALLEKGYPSERILYVPDLVIRQIELQIPDRRGPSFDGGDFSASAGSR